MEQNKLVEDFYQSSQCKICNQNGKSIYSKSYSDEILKSFFIAYYGVSTYENFEKKLETINYELLKCKDCKFVWQKNIPNKNFSIDLYENIIDNEESLNKSKLKYHNQKSRNNKEIKKIIQNFNKEKINILDFGAGWGHWLMSGSSSFYNSYAFELSINRKNFLISNGIKVLNFENLNTYENFFHYIRLDQVLEHLDEPNNALKIIKKLGKKNCIFYISVPDGTEIIEKKNINYIKKGPVQPLEHLNCFSKHSLKKFLSIHGFRPLNLKEIVLMNIKDFKLDLVSLKSFLKDIKSYFFSTSINFKIK
jgi:hypothetical protein